MAAAVTVSLDAMASGGMHDHVGGGFARYSVDREWLVPHFEKMLYDQALLLRVYSHARGRPRHRPLATRRGAHRRVRAARPAPAGRRLRLGRGRRLARRRRPQPRGSVPHVDARRGRAPCSAPTPDAAMEWYGITDGGNFESRSIPNRIAHRDDWVPPPAIDAPRQRLFDAREQRARPGPRRQGDHRVERADDRRRSPRPARCSASRAWVDAASGRRALPARRAARRRPALVPRVARRRRRRGPVTPRSPPTTPRCSTPSPASGRRPGEAIWIYEAMDMRRHAARPLLGPGRGRPVHHARRRRGADRAPEGPLRQRPARRPTRPPPWAWSASPR